jgi:Tfp pilus assembly protein PilO
MGALRNDRIWLLGGFLAVILLGVGGWFLLIHPKYTEAGNVRAEVGNGQVELATLNKQLAKLKTQKAQLSTLTATRDRYQNALPATLTKSMPAFLNELQDSGTAESVDVSGITQGSVQQSAALAGVWEVPITMTIAGTAADLSAFLNRLQTVQARAVLITTASLSGDSTSASGQMTLSLALTAFYAPATGKTTALTTTN